MDRGTIQSGGIIEHLLKKIHDLTTTMEFYRNIYKHLPEPIFFLNKNRQFIDANSAACQFFQVQYDDLLGKSLNELVIVSQKAEENARNESLPITVAKMNLQLRNGEIAPAQFIVLRQHEKEEEIYILKREANEKSEEIFRKVFHGSFDGKFLWKKVNHGEKIITVDINISGMKILNISNGNIEDQLDLIKMVDKCGGKNLKSFLINSLAEKETPKTRKVEFPNGDMKYIEFFSKKDIIPGVNLTLFRDITEKVQMEDKLRKWELLNVAGDLAAGIAHEIRNPMTSLKGFIQLLMENTKDHSMYFNIILAELERIESIVNELLFLAKPQPVQYKHKNIINILNETLELLSAQALLENVQFIRQFTHRNIICYCEPNRLKQVFINIIKNAIEVMPNGGRVTVQVDKSMDDWVCISIADEGTGIPEEKLKSIGRPFYTTKERGTGLGLMVSFKIVEEHGGKIDIESEVGVGTTFKIYLPIARKEDEA